MAGLAFPERLNLPPRPLEKSPWQVLCRFLNRSHREFPYTMIKLEVGESLGTYRVRKFVARGGFALVYQASDKNGDVVALKVGDVAGGGRYVTRFLDVTNERKPEGISPDETPAEAIFFRKDGARIDFLDAHEIDTMVRSEGSHPESEGTLNAARLFRRASRRNPRLLNSSQGYSCRMVSSLLRLGWTCFSWRWRPASYTMS